MTRRRAWGPPPAWVGFYRWHVPDPIVFASDRRVTIQQIGAKFFAPGEEDHGGRGGLAHRRTPGAAGLGICERVDAYGATSYVYCREPQSVPAVDIEAATADIARLDHESP